MAKFVAKVLVTYEVNAENLQNAYNILYYNTEHPVFPDGSGGCIDDEVISIEEVA